MTEPAEDSSFSRMSAALEAMVSVSQAAMAIYISQVIENILARIAQMTV